ncbi:MAG TPA: ammonium transporter [Conexibacter sp.]|jgi:Amt family ammonium transporter|nr:ammonium transporter [Conexibacter sp.]
MPAGVDSGDTAWLMASTAMVLLMTPGLAFFYGGMVRTSHVLVMLRMSFACLCIVTVIWFLFGWSLAFSGDVGGAGLIGNLKQVAMHGIGPDELTGRIPTLIFSCFMLSFAIITVALISGSIAGRTRFDGWMAFAAIWTVLVYIPLAHWVFSPHGWVTQKLGALDFAGGTVVELNSGMAGLACVLALRRPGDLARGAERPHSIPLVAIGLGLLWFGWFGFNAGSALQDQGAAPSAFINTQLGAAGAMAGWWVLDRVRFGKVDMIGVLTSAVAGMVAITPACGEVNTLGAILIGLAAGIVCSFAIGFKFRLKIDDTLDVVGVHGWGGIVGMLAIGLFATGTFSGKEGLFFHGGAALLGKQVVAVLACGAYSFVLTWLIAKAVDKTVGFRAADAYAEVPGGMEERAYSFDMLEERG